MQSEEMTKSVLVVGGAGYLGCVLVDELLQRGYDVTVFDRLFFGDFGIQRLRDRVRLVAGDMRCFPAALLDTVSAVINVGGLSNDPTAEHNPDANLQMNCVATRLLAEAARGRGVSRYIYASSCSVYDVGVVDEERDVLFNESASPAPRAAYSLSKLAGERELLSMTGPDFCPVILRMGTLFGFSPRMRYDLVVNTFVKDALSKGTLHLHYGGQMWRPLLDVRDAARAYILALEAASMTVSGQIFNLVTENFRISELALRVREALEDCGIAVDIKTSLDYAGIRNYRVSGKKALHVLGFRPMISVQESVEHMVSQIREYGYTDFDNDRYYNIRWMKLLESARRIIDITGTIFEMPAGPAAVRVTAGAGA